MSNSDEPTEGRAGEGQGRGRGGQGRGGEGQGRAGEGQGRGRGGQGRGGEGQGRAGEGVVRREGVLEGAASWGVSAQGLTSMRGRWVVRVEGPHMLSIHVETLGGRGRQRGVSAPHSCTACPLSTAQHCKQHSQS